MLAVQWVEIFWTKATRGAPRANERVALPRAFAWVVPQGGVLATQHYRLHEEDGFQPRLVDEEVAVQPGGVIDMLACKRMADGWELRLLGTPGDGQPRRPRMERALCLHDGEAACIVVNSRHTGYFGQFYRETIYNVACGEQVPVERFLRPPEHLLDMRAHLF